MLTDLSDDEIVEYFATCSNTGRWGLQDESGTLNLIVPANRIAAAGLIREGETVALGRTLVPGVGVVARHPVTHYLLHTGSDPTSAVDVITITPHDPHVTHIDALGHVFWDGFSYNGRRRDDVLSGRGLTFGSTRGQREGIFTRGVLLDVAAARGVAYLAADDFVTVEDLEHCEQLQGTRVGEGDALVLHVGRERRAGQRDYDPLVRAGLHASVLPWLHTRGVAVFSGDCTERLPYPSARVPVPLHQIGIVAMGLCLVDGALVDRLVEACGRLGRWEFAFTVAPVDVEGSTGFPVNPLCIF